MIECKNRSSCMYIPVRVRETSSNFRNNFVAINLGAQLQILLTPQKFTCLDINTEPLVNQNETMSSRLH